MIVASGGVKGGSGKTTIATNLAIMRSAAGKDVLLIDADEQSTSSDFTVLRNKRLEKGAEYTCIQLIGSAVRTEGVKLTKKYEDIVIDVGGRDTSSQRAALVFADILLVPFVPRSFDVWTLEQVSEIIAEMRNVNPHLKAYAFINKADPTGHDNQDAAEIIRETSELEFIDTSIGIRKAFAKASGSGLGVTEYKPQDLKANNEIKALYDLIYDCK